MPTYLWKARYTVQGLDLARGLSLAFSRIQFTPDLMPSDITGTEVIEENRSTGHREFKFLEGPLFANIILADEINRTPPKTQAALLEAMQERQVTVGRVRHRLSDVHEERRANGARFGRDVVDFNADQAAATNTGQLVIALDVKRFAPLDEFKREIDRHARALRASQPLPGVEAIRLPGEARAQRRADRLRNGVPLQPETWEAICATGRGLGVAPPD